MSLFSSERWLLTGATGRVGRMLARHWREAPPAGAEVLLQSRESRPGTVGWDILRQPLPAAAGGISVLIAFAGVTPGPGADPAVNAALAEATLAAAHGAGVRRVLLTSSSAVYGARDGGAPFAETDPLAPLNPYGEAKRAMEAAVAPWRERGLEVCCLRIGNVAGADALLLNAAKAGPEGAPLRIDRFASGGGPLRSYVGPATLARIVERLARTGGPLPDVLNIGAPAPVAMADLAAQAHRAGLGPGWDWQPAPASAVERITLDTARLSALYSFGPADSSPAEMVRQWARLKDRA